jgi:hypothetical protein
MLVVIIVALVVLIALRFAAARGSGDSRSGGRHSRGHQAQGQIAGHPAAADAPGSDAIGPGHAQHFVSPHGHVPSAEAVVSGDAARNQNSRKVTSQLAGRAAGYERVTHPPGNRGADP